VDFRSKLEPSSGERGKTAADYETSTEDPKRNLREGNREGSGETGIEEEREHLKRNRRS
jgi:hypothetical protein